MDMSLYPHAVAMSADEFMTWSDAIINDLLRSRDGSRFRTQV